MNLKAHGKHLAFFLSLALLLLSMIPSLILRDQAYVRAHDQLDGEIPAYVLQTLHAGDADIPEFMSGENNKASLAPASPGTLLFYRAAEPALAFVLNECFVRLMAFLGLFLLLRRLEAASWVAAVSALLFTLLPFYSVYGLAVMGQPLLLYAVLMARDGKKVWPYALGALFAAFSSPVLVGYADCLLLAGWCVTDAVRKKPRPWASALMLGVLAAVYVALNLNLVKQLFGGGAFVTHRSEWVLTPDPWWDTVKSMFNEGVYHAEASQGPLTGWVLAACGVGLLFPELWDPARRETLRRLWAMTLLAAGVAVIYATWRSAPVISLRAAIGGPFLHFRFERFFWLNPLAWWTAAGLTLQLLGSLCRREPLGPEAPARREAAARRASAVRMGRIAARVLCGLLICSAAVNVYDVSPLKENLRRLSAGVEETASSSFRTFVSKELFEEIDEYIGRPKDSYRVGSVGLYSSVPLLNGFQCVDGYSNNYDVEYKHAFRETIEGELKKKKSVRTYFDEWGNRCYLFSAELGKSYFFTKEDDTVIKKLALNPEALRALGCEYIFSGVEIEKPEKSGLKLLNTFEKEGYPYRIRVYEVESGDEE